MRSLSLVETNSLTYSFYHKPLSIMSLSQILGDLSAEVHSKTELALSGALAPLASVYCQGVLRITHVRTFSHKSS